MTGKLYKTAEEWAAFEVPSPYYPEDYAKALYATLSDIATLHARLKAKDAEIERLANLLLPAPNLR